MEANHVRQLSENLNGGTLKSLETWPRLLAVPLSPRAVPSALLPQGTQVLSSSDPLCVPSMAKEQMLLGMVLISNSYTVFLSGSSTLSVLSEGICKIAGM